jgi:hypothetical protein
MRDEAKGGNMSHFDDGALHAYLDGELAPGERAQIEAHVADCAVCRTRLDEERVLIQRASQLLGFVQPQERAAPPPLHQLRHPRLVWRLRMPLAWAASVVVALGLGYYARDGMPARRAPVPEVAFLDSPDNAAATEQAEAVSRAPELATRRSRAPAERRDVNAPAAPELPRASVQKAREPTLVVDGSLYGARTDTARAAAGVVAIQSQAEPRAAAPGLHLDAVVVTSAEAGRAAARDQPVATEWPIIEREPARVLLGAHPVGVPGLPVRQLRRSPAGDVVLVEQQVDSSAVILLFQRRVEAERQAAPEAALALRRQAAGYAGTERLARFVGSLRVEIAGPFTSDSLSRLLERVKPIQ